MLDYRTTSRFDKDFKKMFKQGRSIKLLEQAMKKIVAEELLEASYKLHTLEPKNQIPKRFEIHLGGLKSEWLLIYYIEAQKNLVVFERTGSHADLFK